MKWISAPPGDEPMTAPDRIYIPDEPLDGDSSYMRATTHPKYQSGTPPTIKYIRRGAFSVSWFKAAKCPACDGSGSIPSGPLQDGSWEARQCEWCNERGRILSLLEGE